MLLIKASFINADTDILFAEPVWHRPFTEDRGELYRSCRDEYGRCTGKVYSKKSTGDVPVGWVFQKRDKYEGEDRTYLREVWIEVRELPEVMEA